MSEPLYFEDFSIGQVLETRSYLLMEDECIAFARQYDPQYFHIDPEAAKSGPFGRLIASGWQTAAVAMKLKAETELSNMAGGLLGLGLEQLKWPRPVFPGDSLTVRITMLDKRLSASKPTYGILKYRMETFNQHMQLVMETVTAVWAPVKFSI